MCLHVCIMVGRCKWAVVLCLWCFYHLCGSVCVWYVVCVCGVVFVLCLQVWVGVSDDVCNAAFVYIQYIVQLPLVSMLH